MGKLLFAVGSIEFEGDGTEIVRSVSQILDRTFGSAPAAAAPALIAGNGEAAPVARIEQGSTGESPTSHGRQPRKKQPRRPRAKSGAANREEEPVSRPRRGRPPKERVPLPAGDPADFDNDDPPAKRGGALADKIADQIGKYGKLSRMQLAMKLLKSEKAIGIAIGQAGSRFSKDEDGFFTVNG